MGTLLQDLKYGVRVLLKSPGFTAIAVLTLALGIGANTALFSIVNAVLVNPLPYPDSGQLVTFYESKQHFQKGSFSYLDFLDIKSQNQSFSSIAAYRQTNYAMTGVADAEQVNAEMVTAELFPMLNIKPVLGRVFTTDEDRLDAAPVALLDESLWKRKFSSSPDVLNKVITLDGRNYTVIGVVPSKHGLFIQNFRDKNDLYVLMGQNDDPMFRERSSSWGTDGIGRMKSGVKLAQARADLNTVTHRLAADYPDVDAGIGATVVGLKDEMVGDVKPILLVLLGAVGFVLLIACANVANLLLARATGRTREFAVRVALGASQNRLVRQLLTESVLLALVGGVAGLFLAAWGARAGLRILPATLPRADQVGVDSHVLIFTFVVSVVAGILFGLAPAFRTSRKNLQEVLQEGGRGSSAARQRTQGIFVAVEMAMALVLLIGAGLMLRTLTRLWNVDPGFNAHNVLTFEVSTPLPNSHPSQQMLAAGLRQMHETLKAIPGVQSVSLSWGATPMRSDDEEQFWIEGQPKPTSAKEANWCLQYVVEPEYFDAIKVSLKRGRLLSAQDDEHAHPVVLIDERFAEKYFPNQDPLGKYVNLIGYKKKVEIVGIVGHVKQFGLSADDSNSLQAQLYIPLMQVTDQPYSGAALGANVYVRSSESTSRLEESIRRSFRSGGGQQIMSSSEAMSDLVAKSVANQRFTLILLGVFAALALVLAVVGIYGVVSYLVGQRTREIGIRIALGAQRTDVLRLVLGAGVKMALVGIAAGLAISIAVTRLLQGMLFGVKPLDPLTFVSVGTLLCGITLLACYVPAQRATRVDPVTALRYE